MAKNGIAVGRSVRRINDHETITASRIDEEKIGEREKYLDAMCSSSLSTTLHFFLLTRSHALCRSSVDLDATTASPMHRTCPLATGKLSIPDKHTSIQPICIYANKSLVYRIWFAEIDDASCEWPFKKWDDFWRVNENRFAVKRHRRLYSYKNR